MYRTPVRVPTLDGLSAGPVEARVVQGKTLEPPRANGRRISHLRAPAQQVDTDSDFVGTLVFCLSQPTRRRLSTSSSLRFVRFVRLLRGHRQLMLRLAPSPGKSILESYQKHSIYFLCWQLLRPVTTGACSGASHRVADASVHGCFLCGTALGGF